MVLNTPTCRAEEGKPMYQTALRVPSDLSALATVLHWFEQLKPLFHSEDSWLQCEIALAEGFTNAVRHAHGSYPKDTPVDLEAQVSTQGLEISIWDRGLPFDLMGYLQTLPLKSHRDAEGGRGLQLMRAVADRLSYTRTADERNCLTIVKALDAKALG